MTLTSNSRKIAQEQPIHFNNNNNDNEMTTLGDFFANKSVFITGGTGFLGTVLIEALLNVSPDIGKIYVLVRDKYGHTPEKRIERLLSKQLFKNHGPEILKKVIPVVGELTEPFFNFEKNILEEIIENVNIIYHSAATIKFNSRMKTSVEINILGTLRTIELAKKLRTLSSYVYFSTAFCNSNKRGMIMEQVYSSQWDPYEIMKLAKENKLPSLRADLEFKKLVGTHPNTYTFTKQLAENLIVKEMSGLPVGIVRPSVVYGTYENPVKGWIGNANSGHLGFIVGFAKGIFRTISGNPSSAIDIIPCDYVINSSLAMAWYVGTRAIEEPEVIHSTSGELNPLALSKFCEILNEGAKQHPCNKFLWKPHVQLRNSWRYKLFFYLFHIIPAIVVYVPEKILKLGRPPHSTLSYMRVFDRGTKAFEYFLDKDFKYSLKNSMRIQALMTEEDSERYCFDARKCDWFELISRCLQGVRYYYFRESAKTTYKHKVIRFISEIGHWMGYAALFFIIYLVMLQIFSLPVAFTISSLLILFLIWL